jgi:hypothetical protein
MKTTYLLLFCVIVLLNSGCKKCPTTTHYPFPAAAELYFGMYKQGNWWTYENQDGTKKDSIYFTQFLDNIAKDNTSEDCVTWQHREGNMGSNYLYAKSNSGVSYVPFIYSNPYDGISSPIYTSINLSGTVQERLVTYKDGILYQDTIITNFSQNSKSYFNVIKNRNNKYFAPNIGLIRWEIGTDTFTLKKYHIQ